MAKKITKRKDGRYVKQITIGIKNGKIQKKSIYARTQKELENKVSDFISLKNRGIIINNDNITVPELAKEWYQMKKYPLVSKYNQENKNKTIQEYNIKLKQIERLFAGIKVKDVSEYEIQNRLLHLAMTGSYDLSEIPENPVQKTYTAKDILNILKKVFNYAIKLHIIYSNPCSDIFIEHTPKKKRALTDIEKLRIEKATLNKMDKAWLYLLRYTGMRIGESIALYKDDIDFVNGRIRIYKDIFDNNGKPVIQNHVKTEAGFREPPILDPLILPLREYIDSLPKDQKLLFANKNGNIFSTNSLSWVIKRWRKEVGLPDDVTFHTFRHNFITECFEAGIDIAKVQKWVGHSDYSTTMNIYNHLKKITFEDGEEMNNFYSKNKSKISQNENYNNLKIL